MLPSGVRAAGLARWLEAVVPARARGTVTVAVVSNARVRELNRRHRRKDTPTDVLSFPADEPGELGDVVIALGVARRRRPPPDTVSPPNFVFLPCTVCTSLAMITNATPAR